MFKILLLVVFAAMSNGKTRPPLQVTNHEKFITTEECEAALSRHEQLVRLLYRDQALKSVQGACTEYTDKQRKDV